MLTAHEGRGRGVREDMTLFSIIVACVYTGSSSRALVRSVAIKSLLS